MRVLEVLLITIALHLCSGHTETCPLADCLSCPTPPVSCPPCLPGSFNCTAGVPQNCTTNVFNVSVESSSTAVASGDSVTLNCTQDLPNGSVSWSTSPGTELLPVDNSSISSVSISSVSIATLSQSTVVTCSVSSVCGSVNASATISVNAQNNQVIILICVGAAAALLTLFGVVMKVSLRRGQAQSQARKRQREQHLENIHSTVNTVSTYY